MRGILVTDSGLEVWVVWGCVQMEGSIPAEKQDEEGLGAGGIHRKFAEAGTVKVGPSEVIQGPSWVNLVGATALGRDF